jgi:hypothetical protein
MKVLKVCAVRMTCVVWPDAAVRVLTAVLKEASGKLQTNEMLKVTPPTENMAPGRLQRPECSLQSMPSLLVIGGLFRFRRSLRSADYICPSAISMFVTHYQQLMDYAGFL